MTMISTGVANTGGRIASLNRFCKMFGLDEEVEGALGSQGYLPHGLLSNDRSDESEVPNLFPGAGKRDQHWPSCALG